jgi:hypothetical protein
VPADPQLLDRFMLRERKLYGGGRARYKDEEWGSKVRGFYARIFNPRYMMGYITTLYPDTFFPSKQYVADSVYRATKIEFHENVHKWDRWNDGFMFTFKYAYPQIFAVPFIIAAVALGGIWGWLGFAALLVLLHVGLGALAASAGASSAGVPTKPVQVLAWALLGVGGAASIIGAIIGGGWFALLWLPVILFLSPWPLKAKWRRDYEIRGYTMSLYAEWLRHGHVRNEAVVHYVSQFTGPAYFYMETDEDYVRARFLENMVCFKNPGPWWAKKDSVPYETAQEFMIKEGLVSGS